MKVILIILFMFSILMSVCSIGVNVGIGQISNSIITDEKWLSYIKKYNITTDIKYFWRDINQLEKQFNELNYNTSAIIAIQNHELPLTIDQSLYIINLYKKFNFIKAFTVGNELDVILNPNDFDSKVIQSMNNLNVAMNKLNVSIPITTPLTMSIFGWEKMVLQNEWKEVFIKLLNFYKESNSYVMFNIYPYLSWLNHKNQYMLDYALTNMILDKINQIYKIIKFYGFDNIKLIIGETGWPTNGNDEANVKNAYKYWININNIPYDIYWFELIDEDLKPGFLEEKYYGLFTKDGKYKFSNIHQYT